MDNKKDEDRIKAFKKYVRGLKEEAEAKMKPKAGDKTFETAGEAEKKAAAFLDKKDIESAIKALFQAGFLYEKAVLTPLPSKKK